MLTGSIVVLVAVLRQNAERGPRTFPILPAIWIVLPVIVIFSVTGGRPGVAVLASLPSLVMGLYLLGANNAFRLVGVAVFVMFFAAVANWIAAHDGKFAEWRRGI